LLGTESAIRDFLPQAEVVFEYRSGEYAGPAQDRRNFAGGFLSYDDDLAKLINLRNDKQHIQDGLFIWDVPTFDDRVVREAVLNAVSHRDYRLGGSTLIRQYPKRLEVVSPGGFPEGVTPENILWQQNPRNRRVAEALARCGLVDRSGQGADVMFEQSIRAGKAKPDYSKSDDWQVHLDLNGLIQDIGFLRYLERATQEKHYSFSTEDLLVLNDLRTKDRVPDRLAGRLEVLRDAGLIETVGRGRGARYMLSKALYTALGKQAGYTRRRGLDRQTNKELLLRHLREFGSTGVPLRELCRVVPDLGYYQVRTLLKELKAEGRVYPRGLTRAARWHLSDAEKDEPLMAHDGPDYYEV
jgi:ATP-dependent DNA helicase RecG